MTDQLTLANAAWATFTDVLERRIEQLPYEGFMIVAPVDGDPADGLRIHQYEDGWRLIRPRSMPDPRGVLSDRRSNTALSAGVMASVVVIIARQCWCLSDPDQIADIGREFQPTDWPLANRIGPDNLRRRVRDDLADFVGGAPTIDPDAIIRIPGADFATSVAVSMEKPQLDIFARVITDLPFDVSAQTLSRLLGSKIDGITLVVDGNDLYAATFCPCEQYNFHYLCWYLARWFEFVDDGLPVLREALGRETADGGPPLNRVPRPSVDLMVAEAWETYVDVLAAEIEALEPAQRLTVAQSWEYPEGPHGVVVVTASDDGGFTAGIDATTLHPDQECWNEQSELLFEAGWSDDGAWLTIDESEPEAIARRIVDDALVATWDCVHPSFLADISISEQKP